MLHNAAFHHDLHQWLFARTKMILRERNTIYLEIITCDFIGHPKITVWNQKKEESIRTYRVISMGVAIMSKLWLNKVDTVGNVSGNGCRSRGREFDPGLVPYIREDWSWNNFYSHSPPFRWIIQKGLSSVTRKKYVHEVLVNSSADSEGGGDRGVRTPPGKSQVIWVSIRNKQLDRPWKMLDPPWKMLDPLWNLEEW